MTVSKKQARIAIQLRLDAVSEVEYARLSAATYRNVEELLENLFSRGSAQSLLIYRAYPKWREVSLTELENKYITSHFDYAPVTKDAPFPDTQYEVIFVPLYGFTSKGYRLGHGSGWYDRFLLTQPQALKIGVGFSHGRVDFKVDAHDVAMDIIVTDQCVVARDGLDLR